MRLCNLFQLDAKPDPGRNSSCASTSLSATAVSNCSSISTATSKPTSTTSFLKNKRSNQFGLITKKKKNNLGNSNQMVHDASVHADGQRAAADAGAVVGRSRRRRVRVHLTPRPFGGLQRGRRRRSDATSQSVNIILHYTHFSPPPHPSTSTSSGLFRNISVFCSLKNTRA